MRVCGIGCFEFIGMLYKHVVKKLLFTLALTIFEFQLIYPKKVEYCFTHYFFSCGIINKDFGDPGTRVYIRLA